MHSGRVERLTLPFASGSSAAMEGPKDIYHKADPSIPPRRFGRKADEPPRAAASVSSPGQPTTQPVGTQSIGAPISPIQIARQQMQMQPRHRHLRRRRRRKDSEQSTRRKNRVIWILVGLVIVAYVAVLSLTVMRNRLKRAETRTAPAAAAGTRPPEARPAAPATNTAAAGTGLPVIERVQNWSRGARLLDEAATLLNSGRYQQAKERLEKAGQLIPSGVHQRIGMARVLVSERNYRDAEKLLVAAIDEDPTNADVREMLARALIENGRSADAMAVAEWICQADPYSEEGHDVAAAAALSPELNDLPKAIEHLRKLLNLRSDDMIVKNNLGKAYLRAGNVAESRKTFEEIIQTDAQNSQAHYNLAAALVREGRAEEAVSMLSRASARLGENFVATWLSSSDFDSIRSDAGFTALQRRLGAATTAPAPSAP